MEAPMKPDKRTKKQLLADLTRATAREVDNYKNWQAEREKREEAETEAKNVRARFGDLKERLHNAEVEIARTNGYLDRVHEADIARDGMTETDAGDGKKRLVPKWPSRNERSPDRPSIMVAERNEYGRERERPLHWTRY